MSIIRLMNEDDVDKLREIHEKYYKESFSFPIDNRILLDKYVVVDDNGEIIIFGTLQIQAELIAISDLSRSIKERLEAYHKMFQAILFTAGKNNLTIQASANNEDWERHLKKVGFKDPVDKILIYKG
jgi:hypothetical protein